MRAKIELIRVDNRLVHGQVGVTWVNALNIDTIVVVDDETAINVFSQKMMKTIAKASNVDIRFIRLQTSCRSCDIMKAIKDYLWL